MNKFYIVLVACTVVAGAQASWYWPFGDKGDDSVRVRVSELLEPASLLIDAASDYAEEGKINEAVAEYRKALQELDRIEMENADRVGTPEFATVNNKRAYVDAAIDSLLLKQAQQNAKAVAISDTTELEKRYARLKGKDVPAEPTAADEKAAEEKAHVAAVSETKPAAAAAPAEVPAAPAKPAVADSPVRAEIKATLAKDPQNRRARLMLALEDMRAGDHAAALLTLKELLEEKPNDAAALNLRAAVESEMGEYKLAERTLDQSIQSNPRSYYAYYNMARLFIRTRGAAGKASARRYYETGRTFGGPADAELEGLLR